MLVSIRYALRKQIYNNNTLFIAVIHSIQKWFDDIDVCLALLYIVKKQVYDIYAHLSLLVIIIVSFFIMFASLNLTFFVNKYKIVS